MGEEDVKPGEEDAKPDEADVKPDEKPAEPEYNDIEKTAMRIGWNPKHESGDREYVSAEDFIIRSKEIQNTMSKEMKAQNRKLSSLERTIGDLKTHNDSVYKAQVAKLKTEIGTLRTQRRQAVEDGDDKAVRDIDNRIDQIDQIPDEAPTTQTKPNPEFEAWKDKNDWYEADTELKNYADAQGGAPEFQGLPYGVMLDKVKERVQKMFPDKFPKPKEKITPAASSVEKPAGKKSLDKDKQKFTYKDLTDDQKRMCDEFEKHGAMTRKEYIKSLEDAGFLEKP